VVEEQEEEEGKTKSHLDQNSVLSLRARRERERDICMREERS